MLTTSAAAYEPAAPDNESTNCEKLLTGASHPASACMTTLTGTAGFKALYDEAAALFCGP